MKHAVRRKDKLCRIGFRQSQKSLETVSLRPFIAGSGPGVTIPRRTPPRILPRLKTLDYGGHDDRQPHGRVHEDLAKLSAFRRGHELAPGDCLAIGTA